MTEDLEGRRIEASPNDEGVQMDIPDNAVEAAEKAIQAAQEEWHPTILGPGFLARIALEASAPIIVTEALRDAARKWAKANRPGG